MHASPEQAKQATLSPSKGQVACLCYNLGNPATAHNGDLGEALGGASTLLKAGAGAKSVPAFS